MDKQVVEKPTQCEVSRRVPFLTSMSTSRRYYCTPLFLFRLSLPPLRLCCSAITELEKVLFASPQCSLWVVHWFFPCTCPAPGQEFCAQSFSTGDLQWGCEGFVDFRHKPPSTSWWQRCKLSLSLILFLQTSFLKPCEYMLMKLNIWLDSTSGLHM